MLETMEYATGVLALVAAGGALALLLIRVVASPDSALWRIGEAVTAHRLWLVAAIGVVATLASLYFSEIAELVPCRWCWFQRVFMYPIAVVGVIAAIRRDLGARWYLGALAIIGGLISTYHTIIEWRPELDNGTCELFGPACTVVYFRTFGFLSLATMALCGFVAVLVLLFVNFSTPPDDRSQV